MTLTLSFLFAEMKSVNKKTDLDAIPLLNICMLYCSGPEKYMYDASIHCKTSFLDAVIIDF